MTPATWSGGVARSFEEADQLDLDYWLEVPPAQRIAMVWTLVEDVLSLRGDDGAPPRLQRSVGGVRHR
ncbi:MAG: hypothetical protein JJ863_14195 [Deltaproteobacteria bacterium]|nr:hypothetical protein [Deltaproteobacteria bacterium]